MLAAHSLLDGCVKTLNELFLIENTGALACQSFDNKLHFLLFCSESVLGEKLFEIQANQVPLL